MSEKGERRYNAGTNGNGELYESLLNGGAEHGEIEEVLEASAGVTDEPKTTKWIWQKENGDSPSEARTIERQGSFRPNELIDPLLDADYGTTGQMGGWMRIGREGWRRRVSMILICFLVLVGDANRGLVLPTLQGYIGNFGGTAIDLGIANAGFSAGRLVAAPLFGYWMDKRNTGEVVLFSMIVCAVCNFLYTYASLMDDIHINISPVVILVVTRTVLGFGASILGVGRAYIAKQTSKAERGPYIAILCALQYAGFTLTAFISVIDFNGIPSMSLSNYNLPGKSLLSLSLSLLLFSKLLTLFNLLVWVSHLLSSPLLLVLGFVLTVAYLFGIAALCLIPNTLFDTNIQHRTNKTKNSLTKSKYHNSSYPYLLQLEKTSGDSEEREGMEEGPQQGRDTLDHGSARDSESKGSYSFMRALLSVPGTVVIFILLNFTVRAVLATLETLSTYIISYLYTGSTSEKVWKADGAPVRVALTFTCIGIGGLIVFGGVYYLSGHVQDRITLIFGLTCILSGLGLTLDFNDGKGLDLEMSLGRYEAGLAMVWALGYPLSQTVVVSALSKVLTTEQQGVWMGNLASAGSAGRIIAPTLAGYIYNVTCKHTALIPLACCFGITGLSMVMVAIVWKKLKPPVE